jgi:hypothetical protein
MLTKKELLDALQGIPDDAIIYMEADHGQTPEQAGGVYYTIDADLPYYGDDIYWCDKTEDGDAIDLEEDEIASISEVTAVIIR